MTLCECGCGREVKEGNRFIHGHHRKSHMWSDEDRKKLSNINKGKISNFKGKKHTDETKTKISKKCKGKISNFKGENHHNWQGGISFEPYCPKFNEQFKESIREKFGRVCFICSKSEEDNGAKLSVHHVNYDKNCLCSDIKCEFVPLCKRGHGKTNFNREYWEDLIKEKLEGLN